MDKQTIREALKKRRSALTTSDVREKSAHIALRVQSAVQWQNVKHIHVYRSRADWNEVDTSWIEAYVYAIWPHVRVTIGDISPQSLPPNIAFEVILVPLLGFDEHANRLGMGRGWYDTFLSKQPWAHTIGLGFDTQQYDGRLPIETHDVRLDMIITESRTITKSAYHPSRQ